MSASPDVAPAPRSRTVLLAEDQAMIRGVLARVLEGSGFQVIEAFDGKDALERGSNAVSPIDLLVADVIMPNLDGGQLARKLVATWPQLKVLFISGESAEALREDGYITSNSPFLQKPFTMKEFLIEVRRLLNE